MENDDSFGFAHASVFLSILVAVSVTKLLDLSVRLSKSPDKRSRGLYFAWSGICLLHCFIFWWSLPAIRVGFGVGLGVALVLAITAGALYAAVELLASEPVDPEQPAPFNDSSFIVTGARFYFSAAAYLIMVSVLAVTAGGSTAVATVTEYGGARPIGVALCLAGAWLSFIERRRQLAREVASPRIFPECAVPMKRRIYHYVIAIACIILLAGHVRVQWGRAP